VSDPTTELMTQLTAERVRAEDLAAKLASTSARTLGLQELVEAQAARISQLNDAVARVRALCDTSVWAMKMTQAEGLPTVLVDDVWKALADVG